ncbi:phosphonate C-P lyase system protein PhnG [Methylobrevis pamukkalensis]|uniref:Alpha-D-ribose 1-methylphosphonate 5-triphosphate synthase subunit PhnG n=1 Tax=Methylobrevis pamukkalensis TaxID=1439726 RepID=A0A1E3H537_9HYPH|nr:phosphonate C-P lyase system protein PhnG [Methylobrevis pamukkalensis]ODN70611.1 Alpha-D-ribose 1-methylphosphonate 5-triphosphate synthase subunit PhnG [Methylobrevis pamukkalensis]
MLNEADQVNHKHRLDVLATCEATLLAERYRALGGVPECFPVRGPEIGMVMLRGRAGGSGAPFNLGEATVTRASVKLESGEVGHAVILGRDMEKARIFAHLGAMAQRAEWAARIDRDVIAPALAAREADRAVRAEETEATRVDFFTMVRGED